MIWRWLESLLQPPWLLVSLLSRCWSLNTFSTWQIKAASDAVSMAQNVRRQKIMTWFKFWHETWPMWQALRCFPFKAGILTETHILSSYLFQVWLSSIPDIWHLSFRFPAKSPILSFHFAREEWNWSDWYCFLHVLPRVFRSKCNNKTSSVWWMGQNPAEQLGCFDFVQFIVYMFIAMTGSPDFVPSKDECIFIASKICRILLGPALGGSNKL